MKEMNKNKVLRNVIIFYVGTLLLSMGGGFIMATGEEAGGLLFILSPLIMVLIARFMLGDGWQDAGLRLNLSQNWGWYLFAVLGYLVIFPLSIGINSGLGFSRVELAVAEMLPVLITGFAVQFVPRMIFSLSEEWGWRGYLEPKLKQLGFPAVQRHLLVSLLWGVWHFPLILSTDYTTTPIYIFLPLFMLGIIPIAFVWGQMRELTGSVWPVVLMHGMANTLGYAILESGVIAFEYDVLGSIAAGNIILTLIWAAIAAWRWQHSRISKQIAIA